MGIKDLVTSYRTRQKSADEVSSVPKTSHPRAGSQDDSLTPIRGKLLRKYSVSSTPNLPFKQAGQAASSASSLESFTEFQESGADETRKYREKGMERRALSPIITKNAPYLQPRNGSMSVPCTPTDISPIASNVHELLAYQTKGSRTPSAKVASPPTTRLQFRAGSTSDFERTDSISPVLRAPSPDPCDIAELCACDIMVHFEDPELIEHPESSGGLRRRSSDATTRETQELVSIGLNTKSSDVVLGLLHKRYGDEWFSSQDTEQLLEQFGLYEAEFVRDDEDEYSMGLFSAASSEVTPSVENKSLFGISSLLTPISEDQESSANKEKGADKPSRHNAKSLSHRVISRALRVDESPLFVYHNWKFASPRPLLGRKKSSPSPDHSGGSARHLEPREFHFLVKRMEFKDLQLVKDRPSSESNVKHQNSLEHTSEIIRAQQYKNWSIERLQRRLRNVSEEEERRILEIEEKYKRQANWIRSSFDNGNLSRS
ncbi:hypothetical protein MP638_006478 [Amoeboaphelidium occidentale]|nr:hypothetical protein MP638_006478 [Amoeboaphelidium occidentale]